MRSLCVITFIALAGSGAFAQTESNPDFRIRAKFRNASDESVGNADFRVQSRFLKVYYGGVLRKDDFKFKIGLESLNFANEDFDVFLWSATENSDIFIATVTADTAGIIDVTYKNPFNPISDSGSGDLPLPASFPGIVDVGDIVKIFSSASNTVPLLQAALEEDIARGDVNQDGKVDEDDFVYLEANFGLPGVGPIQGDFNGDNVNDMDDYNLFVQNRDDQSSDPPSVPAVAAILGDATLDGVVNGDDLLTWQANLFSGAQFVEGDFNLDGVVNGDDLLIWQSNLFNGVPAPSPIPEPGTAALLGALLSVVAIRRKR